MTQERVGLDAVQRYLSRAARTALAVLALLAAAVLVAGGYDDGRELLCSCRTATSPSPVGSSRGPDRDLLFTHNDSGDTARFFAVDRTCRTDGDLLGCAGVQARDWEDVSRGPGGTLWLGDIGDNSGDARRAGCWCTGCGAVPVRRRSSRATSFGSATRMARMTLRRCWSRRADGWSSSPRASAAGGVYATDATLRTAVARSTSLRRSASAAVSFVTGGDISPDGPRVVLRNYAAAYEWDVGGGDVVAAFAGEPTRIALPADRGRVRESPTTGTAAGCSPAARVVGAPIEVLR